MGSKTLVKSIACAPKDASPDVSATSSLGRLAWHPSGRCLAIPTTAGVRVVSTSSWADVALLSSEGEPISAVAWSPNGRYLCAASQKLVSVWNVEAKKVVKKFSSAEVLLSLAWTPGRGAIATIDKEGEVSFASDVIAKGLPTSVGDIISLTPKEDATAAAPAAPSADGEDGEDDAIADVKMLTGFLGLEHGRAPLSHMQEKRLLREGIQEQLRKAHEDMIHDDDADAQGPQVIVKEVAPPRVPAQEPFNPSSSGYSAADPNRKYLVWNSIGSIVSRRDDAFNSIEIEFADASVRGLKITDHYGFTLGSMSSKLHSLRPWATMRRTKHPRERCSTTALLTRGRTMQNGEKSCRKASSLTALQWDRRFAPLRLPRAFCDCFDRAACRSCRSSCLEAPCAWQLQAHSCSFSFTSQIPPLTGRK